MTTGNRMNADDICRRLQDLYVHNEPCQWRDPATGENTVVYLSLARLYRLYRYVIAEYGSSNEAEGL